MITRTNWALLSGLALSLSLLVACNGKKTAEPLNEQVNSYVYAYTSGAISRTAPIRVSFSKTAVSADQIGLPVEDSPISFSPSIKGVATWENENTLLFEPANYLESGIAYLATVQLSDIFPKVPKEARSFSFDFRTRDMYFQVEVEGLQAPDPQNLSVQELTGTIVTSDAVMPEKIRQVLSASQNGKDLPIRWNPASEITEYEFVVEQIERAQEDGRVLLSWNGKPLDLHEKGEKVVEIPGLSNFKLMDARVFQHPQQYIQLHFSDPLLPDQNLQGLVSVEGYSGELRFSIDGNKLLVYPASRLAGSRKITVFSGLRNTNNSRMKDESIWNLMFEEPKPQLRLVGRGVILPNSEGLIFPFDAINLTMVDVEIFKIYHNNVLQFLQNNDLDGQYELKRVGRIVHQSNISLKSLNPQANMAEWTRYALDLSKLIRQDPEAIYQVRLGFRMGYTNYHCAGDMEEPSLNNTFGEPAEDGEFESIWDGWYGVYGYYNDYRWDQREDPCYPAYYNNDNFVRRNVLVSDLGIIAKEGKDNSLFLAVSDLRTAQPVSGATIEIYDYQQQLLQTTSTDGSGIAQTSIKRNPFVAIVRKGNQSGYLKLADGMSLSVSRFDVGGVSPQKGLKGYIYGDRGVWRPGDSLYLNFVLEDKDNNLPPDHPIQFELYNARGQLYEKRTTALNVNGVYPLYTQTAKDAPTGNWIAKVLIGGATFQKPLKIETVKPNRLKIEMEPDEQPLTAANEPHSFELQVNWLHGAPGANLKTRVELQMQAVNTTFDKYGDFEFDDPARSYYTGDPQVIFEGETTAGGSASFSAQLLNNKEVPGKMLAKFSTRAFEKGGDFSSDNRSFTYHPYPAYTGVAIPQNQYGSKRLEIGEAGSIDLVIVDQEGNPLPNKKLNVGLYRVNWRWWWDRGRDYNLSDFSSASHYNAQETAELVTNSQGIASWQVKVEEWGRYLVRVSDKSGGHCAGDFFYAGYPWYDSDGFDKQQAAMLAFSSDKTSYEVGETIQLKVPASADSRMLLTLENGTKVIQSSWKEAKAGENTFQIKATAEMTPTIYAHVALLQPHAQTTNDLPIRMYGVIPIEVVDPGTKLAPRIKMADELKPEEKFAVEVSETSGKDMAYTIAIVDEGLLDLTRFKTPNPWDAFYAREALGVKTYDVYDQVLGAFGGELERLLSIGGGVEIAKPDADEGANRFKPVVMHAGPFYLEKGKKAKHEFKMPNYIGSVRAMVVATGQNAYGSTEKTVPVRKPLMVLTTLPRVLGPKESLKVPVSLFAMDKNVKEVTIKIEESSGIIKFPNGNSQTVTFSDVGEQMAYIDIQVGEEIGIAKFIVSARSGSFKASQEIELDVRNPNPYVTRVERSTIQPGQNWNLSFETVGMPGTNSNVLEVSVLPPINLGERLQYLLRYPYGCIEQTLSSGFPQLYVDELLPLSESEQERVQQNVQATIDRLRSFMTAEGGFSYWPGGSSVNHWSNTYAGHFLLEAADKGYAVPSVTLNRWKKYQEKLARMWDPKQYANNFYGQAQNELSQAYRLYTLALAKDPDLASMNRLRELNKLSDIAKWRLAGAYALAGKSDIALQMIQSLPMTVEDYRELGGTFGSSLRDKAMILEVLVLLKQEEDAIELVRVISDELSAPSWHSTQTIAYSLLAVGKFVKNFPVSDELKFAYQTDRTDRANAGSDSPVFQVDLDPGASSLTVENTTDGILYARLIRSGQPVVGDQTAASNNLDMQLSYKTLSGTPIDPSRISQGTDFFAEVVVIHPGYPFNYRYEELALETIFPSGWEILNTRMDNMNFNNSSVPEYQDIRDDRVYTFFDLNQNKQQVYRIRLNAAYAGRYYLPSQSCQAMYDDRINAYRPGQWVEVTQ